MIQRDHGEFCCRAEWPIGLRAVTPYPPANPLKRYAVTDLFHAPRAMAMRNHARVWHAEAEAS